MSIADELRKLQELHRTGALTDAEFAQAKARVLAEGPQDPHDETLRDHLTELKRETALDRLDREWDRQRYDYQVSGRYGSRYTPSKAGSLIMGAIIIAFGIVWTVMAASIGGGTFGLFGVIFVLAGVGMTAFSFFRASQYDQAYRRYQRRRALLLAGEDDAEPDDADESRAPWPVSTAIQDLAEPAPCLRCGRTIPAGEAACPHCGWTYS